jgi:ribonuclease HI
MEDLNSAIPIVEKKGIKGGQQQQPRWIPPPPGMMKVNMNAAMSKNSTRAVLATVGRDASGMFLGASAEVVEGVSDPKTAEVLAVREGLALAKDLMGQRVQVATDCANVVQSLQGPGMGLYGHIVREIKEGLSSLTSAEVIHDSRSSNADAHMLAKCSVYDSVGRHVWFLSPPYGVCTSYSDS